MRPIIGITPSLETNESKIYTPTSYPKAVIQAGGTPVFLNFTRDDEMIEQYAAMVDGVLFSGGDDVDPASYDEEQIWGGGDICPLRDDFEIKLLKVLVEKYPEKPVLGICRGAQVLNVAMGGTLYQDLRSQVPGCIRHQQQQSSHCFSPASCSKGDFSPAGAVLYSGGRETGWGFFPKSLAKKPGFFTGGS